MRSRCEVWILKWRVLMIITEIIHLRIEAGLGEGDDKKQPSKNKQTKITHTYIHILSERVWRKWCSSLQFQEAGC